MASRLEWPIKLENLSGQEGGLAPALVPSKLETLNLKQQFVRQTPVRCRAIAPRLLTAVPLLQVLRSFEVAARPGRV